MPPSRASTRATPAPEVGPAPIMIARVLGADILANGVYMAGLRENNDTQGIVKMVIYVKHH